MAPVLQFIGPIFLTGCCPSIMLLHGMRVFNLCLVCRVSCLL
jgi:hypothetical protein